MRHRNDDEEIFVHFDSVRSDFDDRYNRCNYDNCSKCCSCNERCHREDCGRRGPRGPRGPMGPQGEPGPRGPQGLMGPQGVKGCAGPTGSKGATGPQGREGPQGPKGYVGPMGPRGPQGDRGIQGIQGPTGPKGEPGSTSLAGSAYLSATNVSNKILSIQREGTALPFDKVYSERFLSNGSEGEEIFVFFEDGVYMIDYSINLVSSSSASSRIIINDNIALAECIPSSTTTSYSSSIISHFSKDTTIKLELYGKDEDVTLGNGTSVILTIIRLK